MINPVAELNFDGLDTAHEETEAMVRDVIGDEVLAELEEGSPDKKQSHAHNFAASSTLIQPIGLAGMAITEGENEEDSTVEATSRVSAGELSPNMSRPSTASSNPNTRSNRRSSSPGIADDVSTSSKSDAYSYDGTVVVKILKRAKPQVMRESVLIPKRADLLRQKIMRKNEDAITSHSRLLAAPKPRAFINDAITATPMVASPNDLYIPKVSMVTYIKDGDVLSPAASATPTFGKSKPMSELLTSTLRDAFLQAPSSAKPRRSPEGITGEFASSAVAVGAAANVARRKASRNHNESFPQELEKCPRGGQIV
jgi:hypothetical protein